jgi:thioredoxin 1
MTDLQFDQISNHIRRNKRTAVYFYTPMCGTCKVASKMIDVVEKMETEFSFLKVDLNYAKNWAEKHKIESVPCLMIFENGKAVERLYAFQSVVHIIEKFNDYKKTSTLA